MISTARAWRPSMRRPRRPVRDLLPRPHAAWLALAARGDPPHEAAREAGRASAALLAFEAFFREHQQPIFGYLWRMTGDEQAAYDLSQEAFLRAWRHFDRIRAYDLPGGWLFRVATNLALKHLRHSRVVAGLVVTSVDAASALDAGATSPDPAARLAEDDLVRDVLLDLAPRPRAVLVLHDAYGFTAAEIASMLAMTHAAAKMMLSRAREQFRVRYRRRDDHDGQEARR
jgi:RNA polymerase sigma-70 factor (ECF subfamily)